VPRALYVHRAELARRQGDHAEARAWREQAERVPPQGARDRYLLARERVAQGQYSQAVKQLREAVRRAPKDFAAWYLLGNCYLDAAALPNLGETEAVRCYTVCITLRAGFYGSHYNRGLAHLRQSQYDRAEADFSAALDLCPGLPGAYLHRGLAREGQGKLREALADLTRALQRANPPCRAFFARARLRRRLGDSKGASEDERDGLRTPLCDEESLIHAGVVRAARGEYHGALANFREALRRNPHSLPALYNQALVRAEYLNQPHQAIALLDQVIERYPHLPRPRANRGQLRARLGLRKAAHDDGQVALLLGGKDSEVFFHVACIHAQTSHSHPEDGNEALRLLGMALRLGYGHDQLQRNRYLGPLRRDERFRDLAAAVQTFKACGLRR
jgi:tetratricopeptide (TPR) repeat protein